MRATAGPNFSLIAFFIGELFESKVRKNLAYSWHKAILATFPKI